MDRSLRWPRRRTTLALGLLPVLPTLAACSRPGGGEDNPGSQQSQGNGLPVVASVPNTDLAVGQNRLSLGVLHVPKGQTAPTPIPDAVLLLRFFYPLEPRPVQRMEATPQFRYVGEKQKGLYVAQVEFDQPGEWGVEVTGTAGDQPLGTARTRFAVRDKAVTPAVGSPAPRSRNLTRKDVDDIRKIDSGITPNDMHELSIAEAIEQHKPLVVLFASPGFCVTQTCAPQLGEVQRLKTKYGQEANFVHVEIFKDPMARTPYETVVEWGLTSEPWVFLVDRNGLVAAKYEGPAPFDELEPALQRLL